MDGESDHESGKPVKEMAMRVRGVGFTLEYSPVSADWRRACIYLAGAAATGES